VNVSDLRCFLVVADELHLGRAAERVHLSQSALSRLVIRVEVAVGTGLLDRSGTELTLTRAGAAFAADAAQIVSDVDRAVLRARAASMVRRPGPRRLRQLRVGLLFPAAAELTGPILAAYRASAPDVDLQVIDIVNRGGERALTSGFVDVAFLWSPVVSRGILAVTLFQDRFTLAVASDHRLGRSASVNIEELAEERYTVTTSMSSQWQAASTLSTWQRRPQHALRVRTVTDAMEAIQSGAAVSIGPSSLARFSPVTKVRYLPLEMNARPRSVLCRQESDRRPEPAAFVALASEVALRLSPLVAGIQ